MTQLQGLGGAESDFIPMMTADYYVTLESAIMPGAHVGVLPSGQLTDPAQTNKMTDAAHFKVKYLVSRYELTIQV